MGWSLRAAQVRVVRCPGRMARSAAGSIREQVISTPRWPTASPSGRLPGAVAPARTSATSAGRSWNSKANVTATRCSFCDFSVGAGAGTRCARGSDPAGAAHPVQDHARADRAGVFKTWLGKSAGSRRVTSPDRASVSEMRGVYVPFWTFNARGLVELDRGSRLQLTRNPESYVDRKPVDLLQTRTVTKVRWEA